MRISRSITLLAAAGMLAAGTAATVSVLAPSVASAIPAIRAYLAVLHRL